MELSHLPPEWAPAPQPSSLAERTAARLATQLIRSRLAGWRSGELTIVLPDGDHFTVGARDGSTPERATVSVRDWRFFARLWARGEMGLGESYEAGEWESGNLVAALRLFARNLSALDFENRLTAVARLPDRLRHLFRPNSRVGSRQNIHAHYDLGNDFYRRFLGDSWTYSCAIFDDAHRTLERAQANKHDRIFDLLDLQPGDELLDIGCGWGELAIRAAQTRGARVVGITVSEEQYAGARERVREAGVADVVEIRLCDYRDIDRRFDKIAAVEMIEAVGAAYLETFFGRSAALLKSGGRLALQSITLPEERSAAYRRGVDWTQAYIFPGCFIPSVAALIDSAAKGGSLRPLRFDEIGPHYAPTLFAWRQRLMNRQDELIRLGFDESFLRRWELYFSFAEASFAERTLGNVQLVFDHG